MDEPLEDLQDARADLAAYRRMLMWFIVGTVISVVVIVAAGVVSSVFGYAAEDAVVAMCIPAGVIGTACVAGFIIRVGTAHEGHGRNHPAKKLRKAQRAYNRAMTGGK